MYEDLTKWYKSGELRPVNYVANKLEDFERAFENSMNSSSAKQLFVTWSSWYETGLLLM